MSSWQIKVLYYGKIRVPKSGLTPNLDPDLTLDFPYLGFLLRQGKRNILVDTGISDSFIINGRAWGGYPAEAGKAYLEKSLAKAGVDPLDIDTILFTHLHNDHAANTTMFKKARLIFQKDEWQTLLDPLPVMNIRRDYDPALIEELRSMDCLKVAGDFELTDGIRILKTPGHTPGSMSIAVQTAKGIKVLTGDHFHLYCMAFSKQNTLMDMEGKVHKITPAPDVYGPFIPSSLIYNYYDYYDSSCKIKAVLGDYRPEYLVPGHEPSLLVTGVE
jgi:glyoxylase-like metal-dependent hydrolase (beta-lactamase superfamily II)